VALGLASASEQDRPEDAALRAAIVAYRRARGLVAGADYLRWLEERALSTADLRAHLTRASLRRDERLAGVLETHLPEPTEVAAVIRAEAILGGGLRRWAERLARCAAAARGLDAGAPAVSPESLVEAAAACSASGLTDADVRSRAPRIASLQAAERAFSEAVVTSERIERCLAEHGLEWQRFAWEEAWFTSGGAAREAALWVREEGIPLADVARMARAVAETRSAYADEVPELAGLLAATAPGELIGPLGEGSSWQLVGLLERTRPSVDDGVLRKRAAAEIVSDALERHLAGRVSWHGEL
jgi:hypothetical protein